MQKKITLKARFSAVKEYLYANPFFSFPLFFLPVNAPVMINVKASL